MRQAASSSSSASSGGGGGGRNGDGAVEAKGDRAIEAEESASLIVLRRMGRLHCLSSLGRDRRAGLCSCGSEMRNECTRKGKSSLLRILLEVSEGPVLRATPLTPSSQRWQQHSDALWPVAWTARTVHPPLHSDHLSVYQVRWRANLAATVIVLFGLRTYIGIMGTEPCSLASGTVLSVQCCDQMPKCPRIGFVNFSASSLRQL